jgi:hypothetical protein
MIDGDVLEIFTEICRTISKRPFVLTHITPDMENLGTIGR